MDKRIYSISELASEFSVSTRTIRFYEEKGLLHPTRKGQKRLFSAAERARLTLILRGKRIGLSLEESRDIIEMYEPGRDNAEQLTTLIGKVRERRTTMQAQMRALQNMLAELDEVQLRCEQALAQLNTGTQS